MEGWRLFLRDGCALSALLWLALQDRKHLVVSCVELCITTALLLAAGLFSEVSLQSRAEGLAFGVLLFVFIYFSKEALGVADGIVILVCGAAFGLYETVVCCFFASVYAGGYSLFLLLVKKAGRKTRIPFFPFLLLGYVTLRMTQSIR